MSKLSTKIANKSLDASLSALEIYNKPIFNYREESFAILMINAFELLFKAKIIKDNNDDLKSIYVYYYPKRKNGIQSKQKNIKRNRINEPFTIDINNCMVKLNILLTKNLVNNINLLIEMRDNSIHLMNNNYIKNKLYEVSSGSIRNYIKLLNQWFPEINTTKYNFFITPLNFDNSIINYDVADLNTAQKNFINYLGIASALSSDTDQYELFVKVKVKFEKANKDSDLLVKYAQDGKKINLELTEDMFKEMYPFDYEQIIKKIKERQPNIKINPKFNKIKKEMQKNEQSCKARYLDFINKKRTPKIYYNSNFVDAFLEKYNNKN
jgi:hypothetical protein